MAEGEGESVEQNNSAFRLPDFSSEATELSQSLRAELAGDAGHRSGGQRVVRAERIPKGERNGTLASMAGRMRRAGMSQPEIEAALLKMNESRCDPPLSQDEVLRIAQSISRYQMGQAVSKFKPKPWPEPISEVAFRGLAGDIVRTISPHSEADDCALLIQSLVAFGSVIGHRPYFVTESDYHYLNMDCTLVGRTSKGRKGTSWKHIRRLFTTVDDVWARTRIQTGLSSGEGLIWVVRDPIYKGEELKDEGVTDKRLLVVETEFASVLQMIDREGNTLSPILREAWDSGTLQILTKKSPATATDPHISMIGHITMEELTRHLGETEKANGFANRFLWLMVKRSKCLPDGGKVPAPEFERLARDLTIAVRSAAHIGEITRTPSARELWWQVYPQLSAGATGLFGALTSRAEAQVVRLSCIYALLDRSNAVDRHHLEAALAVWKYCEDSVRYIFGDSLGFPLADLLLHELRTARPEGLSRTEISNRLGRHKGGEEISRALNSLAERGFARNVQEQTEGRPVERWFATERGETSEICEETPVTSPSSLPSPESDRSEDNSLPSPNSQGDNNSGDTSPM
jgi:primase-like protein